MLNFPNFPFLEVLYFSILHKLCTVWGIINLNFVNRGVKNGDVLIFKEKMHYLCELNFVVRYCFIVLSKPERQGRVTNKEVEN